MRRSGRDVRRARSHLMGRGVGRSEGIRYTPARAAQQKRPTRPRRSQGDRAARHAGEGARARLFARCAHRARPDSRRGRRRGSRDSRPALPALGVDRQRRLARPRPAHGRRAARRRPRRRSTSPIADVDAIVKKDSAIDAHARTNTTSVYTAARDLPDAAGEALDGPDLAQRGRGPARRRRRDGRADGRRRSRARTIYRAAVRNHAKLAYDARLGRARGRRRCRERAARGAGTRRAAAPPGRASRRRCARGGTSEGALELETIEPRAVFEDDALVDLRAEEQEPRAAS